MSRNYGPEEKAKLERLIKEGSNVLREVEDLNEGLKDTVKAVAEELQIKPSVLSKALRVAYKAEFQSVSADHEMLETILQTTGRTAQFEAEDNDILETELQFRSQGIWF